MVCIDYFDEQFIIKKKHVTCNNESVITVPLKIPKLSADAVPTLFRNQLKYMLKKRATKRKRPKCENKVN